MASKLFSSFVVAFWAVMMAALVRVEFFPEPEQFEKVPVERIVQRIFSNAEPTRLNVYYQKQHIGTCTLAIAPRPSPAANPAAAGAYTAQADVKIFDLPFYDRQTPFTLLAKGQCDAHYQVREFSILAKLGTAHLDVDGSLQTGKVHLIYDTDGLRQDRQFDLNDPAGAGLADAVGLPALANSAWLTGLGAPAGRADAAGKGPANFPVRTTGCYGNLPIAEFKQKGYRIESKLNDSMWARIWVDEDGDVLLVDTSAGLSMRSELIDGLNTALPIRARHKPTPAP
jgi:hypothetical protein